MFFSAQNVLGLVLSDKIGREIDTLNMFVGQPQGILVESIFVNNSEDLTLDQDKVIIGVFSGGNPGLNNSIDEIEFQVDYLSYDEQLVDFYSTYINKKLLAFTPGRLATTTDMLFVDLSSDQDISWIDDDTIWAFREDEPPEPTRIISYGSAMTVEYRNGRKEKSNDYENAWRTSLIYRCCYVDYLVDPRQRFHKI